MTGPLLALGSAVCFGVADYAGGLLSRRTGAPAVAFTVQVCGLVALLAVSPLLPAPALAPGDLGWGALSGIGTAVGVLFLYRGLTRGDMSVVVPLSAVGGLALAVLVGVALMGERPTLLSWLGIGLAAPAVVLVVRTNGRGHTADPRAVMDGLVSSAGFALQYVALAQAGEASGLWPVAAGRVTSVLTMGAVVLAMAWRIRLPRALAVPAAANGAVAAAGLALYMLATRQEMVAVAVVLSSLYPALPVLLGVAVLGERLGSARATGLLAGLVAVVLLTLG